MSKLKAFGTRAGSRGLRQSENSIRVIVGDPTFMGCQLLEQALLRSRHRCDILESSTSRSAICASVDRQPVDVVILSEDLEEGPYAGFEALQEIQASHPQTRVIMLMRSPTAELVVDAFRLGAKGVFSREGSPELLCKCVHAVHKGQIWANSHELQYLLEALTRFSASHLPRTNGHSVLTRRENEVANLVADGMTNRQVADQLQLREHTVSNYLFRIYEKLGISSRVELVLYVLRHNQNTA